MATAFCSTITAGGTTAANYPTRATAACGATPARYLSACACGPTCTPTPTASPTPTPSLDCDPAPTPEGPPPPTQNLVVNGGFQCGLHAWAKETPDPVAVAGVVSLPGAGASGSSRYFEAHLTGVAQPPVLEVSARVTQTGIQVVGNVPTRVIYYTKFNALNAGFVGVKINGNPVDTVSAADHGASSIDSWQWNEFSWTPGPDVSVATLEFEFIFTRHAPMSASQAIDAVSISWLH